jgi:hypothetical protein
MTVAFCILLVITLLFALLTLAVIVLFLAALSYPIRSFLDDVYSYEQDGTIFLSYRRESIVAAQGIRDTLTYKGLSVFMYDPADPFSDPVTVVSERIRSSPLFILVQSGSGSTEWVEAELDYAKALQKRIVHVANGKSLPTNVNRLATRRRHRWWAVGTVSREFDALQRAYINRASQRPRGIADADVQASTAVSWEKHIAGQDYEIVNQSLLVQLLAVPLFVLIIVTITLVVCSIAAALHMRYL